MAKKTDMTAAKRTRSTTTRKVTAAGNPPAVTSTPQQPAAAAADAERIPVGAKGLLRAGLKALGEVRDDVVERQSRIFEALLGLDSSALLPRSIEAVKKQPSTDAKFEDVFDQRVARSLERLGMPSPQALTALCRQLEAINELLQRSHVAAPPAPAKKLPPKRPTPRKL
jgi:hypothetical protein